MANTYGNTASVLAGRAKAAFEPASSWNANGYPLFVEAADLDGDGDDDLVISNGGADVFTVLINRSEGVFDRPRVFQTGGSDARNLTVGDFNRDGRPDVAVANQQTHSIAVFINTSPYPLVAMAVGTGRIDLAWRDPRSDETGFVIERRTAGTPFATIQSLGPSAGVGGAVSYSDQVGLAAGTYYTYRVAAVSGGTVLAYTNDVEVSTLGGRLTVTPTKLKFGAVRSGSSKTKTLTLRSTGTGPVSVSVGPLNSPFSVEPPVRRFSLAAGATQTLTVQMAPNERGNYGATLQFLTSEAIGAKVSVPITGSGR